MISNRAPIISVLVVLLELWLVSCATPDAVSKFCGSATSTLAAAAPIFDDMKQSCLREVNSRNEFATFTPPIQNEGNCSLIGDQAKSAAAAAKILSEYFTAINSVASFGTSKAGTDAQKLLSEATALGGANSATQTALGSIAQFLVSAATSGYRQIQLEKDLSKASGDVPIVVTALVTIVRDDYIGRQLLSEEQKLSDQYREFARNKSPELTLMLDGRWHADEQGIAARRASAQNLVIALETLSKGFTDLATNSHHLKAKELAGLLEPYAAQLQTLVPQIQKAF